MQLSLKDIDLLDQFHETYWSITAIKLMDKPDILDFLDDNKALLSLRMLTMLSMYYFNFWVLKFASKKPSIEEINDCFKTIKCI